jgi:hypothetical protein
VTSAVRLDANSIPPKNIGVTNRFGAHEACATVTSAGSRALSRAAGSWETACHEEVIGGCSKPKQHVAEQAGSYPSQQRNIRQPAGTSWAQRCLPRQQQILIHEYWEKTLIDY